MTNSKESLFRYASRAAEAGHWYDPVRRVLVYGVPSADGSRTIAPTLREARKFGLLPGITKIISMLERPMLTRWKRRQSILSALTLPRGPDQSEAEWLAAVEADADEHAAQAAARGTEIHAAIQAAVELRPYPDDLQPFVAAVDQHLLLTYGCGIGSGSGWESEVVAIGDDYATKADMLHRERRWLLDFKSTESEEPALYDDHHMQLAATRAALGMHDLRCAIVFVHRTDPDKVVSVAANPADLDRGLSMFRCLLSLWQIRNSYFPVGGRRSVAQGDPAQAPIAAPVSPSPPDHFSSDAP